MIKFSGSKPLFLCFKTHHKSFEVFASFEATHLPECVTLNPSQNKDDIDDP